MRRREIIVGSAAYVLIASRCTVASAQADLQRRVAIITPYAADDREMADRIIAFRHTLDELGWSNETRIALLQVRAPDEPDPLRKAVTDLLVWRPEVILAATTVVTAELARQTQEIPIVFVSVSDPVGSHLVESFARPGGNVTGFVNIDPTLGGKWAQLIYELVPNLRRALIMYNPRIAPYASSYAAPFRAAALQLGFEAGDAPFRSVDDISAVLERLGINPGSGLVVISDSSTTLHRARIRSDAQRFKLPVVWPHPYMAREGGLIAYGLTTTDTFVRAARYVDRILRGDKPAHLPVQQPTGYELVINLRAAKALGLTVPVSLLSRADEVIE
jgi:putative ABC transport system substrate-binding protein